MKRPRHNLSKANKICEGIKIFYIHIWNFLALEREALIFCRLKHKNIVGFFGMSMNPLFLVLELCEGNQKFQGYLKLI